MTGSRIEIRSLVAADVAAMSKLHRSGFVSGWPAAAIDDLVSNPHTLAPGAFDEDQGAPRLIGFALVSVVADEADVLTLVVDPGLRRRGIARRLLEQVIVSAIASGASALVLEVSEANTAARALYGDFSFREVARRPGYYRSRGGAVAMKLSL